MQKLKVVRTGRVEDPLTQYTCPEQVHRRFCREMQLLDREHFVVLHLDSKNHLIARETISVGHLNQSLVHPREVFKGAVLNSSAAIICVHNHPSGDPAPSANDRNITAQLRQAGEILGIRMLDHIIVGNNSFYSFETGAVMVQVGTSATWIAPAAPKRARRNSGKRAAVAGTATG